ncbi:hypothetical protein R1flu_002518 [Riccia fluitans]|uniref:Macro domain-containing protein n=1 Tax=Riccia fluitans TaxID=41844 RepID=A0ABD1Y6B7_9MARC
MMQRLFPVYAGRLRFADTVSTLSLFSRKIRSYQESMDNSQRGISSDRRVNETDDVKNWIKEGKCFELTETCKLVLLEGDITKWHIDGQTDAIVNAANSRLLGGAGVDGAIHDAAGPELREACRQIPEVTRGVRCPTGEARISRGFRLPVSRIIHTVGPIYWNNSQAVKQLTDSYKNSCSLAVQEGVQYIAFPAISCGIYGYPVEEAATVALKAVKKCSAGLQEVHFVLFQQKPYFTWLEEAEKTLKKIQ